jgi:putative acetyltransferase
LVSLVAEMEGHIAGHILFSRMTMETEQGPGRRFHWLPWPSCRTINGVRSVAGWSVAVGARGERIVIVLGHKEYYPRFGFSPEKAWHLATPFPPEAFMALELSPGALAGIHGVVRYPSAFGL